MKYIIAIGIFQAILAAFLLLRSRKKQNADDLLISLVLCIGLHLSLKFVIFSFVKDREVLSMMNTFIGLCYLPLLYLYTLKIISPQFIPASKWYIFIPVVLAAIGYFSTALVLIAASPNAHSVLFWYNTVMLWFMLPFNTFLSVFILRLAKRKLQDNPDTQKFVVQVAALFIVMAFVGFIFMFIVSKDQSLNLLSRSISYGMLIIICIRIIVFKYFERPELPIALHPVQEIPAPVLLSGVNAEVQIAAFEETSLIAPEEVIKEKPVVLTEKRRELLGQSQMFKILLKLENAMKFEKHFTDSELTLDKLSELTGINKYHISETLNHFVNKPFYTFVNEYRIQFVKDRLEVLFKSKAEVNILDLAYESGFKSKSSFNKYFKEITSHTPTEYLNALEKE